MKLNLGSAGRNFPGWLSVDIGGDADIIADLSKPWPWSDSTVDAVKAFQVFEHLPCSIHAMNELWRVLKPGAHAEIDVPSASHGAGAFQDPTHKSFWTLNTFQYFEENSDERRRFGELYGIKARFKVLDIYERNGKGKLREPVFITCARLEAVK